MTNYGVMSNKQNLIMQSIASPTDFCYLDQNLTSSFVLLNWENRKPLIDAKHDWLIICLYTMHTTLQLGTENLNAPIEEANVRVMIQDMNGTFI